VIDQAFFPDAGSLTCRGAVQQEFHERAAQAATGKFDRQVFIRGVVEVSNYCRENCTYCGMRRDNRTLHRFRAKAGQLAELLLNHRPASITDINIQSGEDPVVAREVVLPLIRTLRKETSLGISVCLGTLNPALYAELQAAGACIYIMKFEIANPAQYAAFQAPGTQNERLQHIRRLAETGWKVSSGFIAGLPAQSENDLLANLQLASELPLHGCSVSPFIPGDETPLATAAPADVDTTLNCMAALRLMRPDWIIPAVSALNIADPGAGYRRGLRTGANLVTMNLTPSDMRNDYLLYRRDRFIMTEERILSAIAAENLKPSQQSLAEHIRTIRTQPTEAKPQPCDPSVAAAA
jgi:biotin synthase